MWKRATVLSPHIRGFARFGEGSGQDVREIGVRMGADHLVGQERPPPPGVSGDQGLHRRRGPLSGSSVRYLRDPQRSQFRDLLLGEVGQQHTGRGLTLAKRFWPRPLVRRLPALGWLLLVEAKK